MSKNEPTKVTVKKIMILGGALNHAGLVSKNLNTDEFFSMMCLKKEIADIAETMNASQAEYAREYGAKKIHIGDRMAYQCDNVEFFKRIDELNDNTVEIKNLNFITDRESFKKFVNEVDAETAFTLHEFLLKKPAPNT